MVILLIAVLVTCSPCHTHCRVEKLGYPVPLFDFRVPAVTSMSADIHKYGLGAKVSDNMAASLSARAKTTFQITCSFLTNRVPALSFTKMLTSANTKSLPSPGGRVDCLVLLPCPVHAQVRVH